jgi:hypothetical protein
LVCGLVLAALGGCDFLGGTNEPSAPPPYIHVVAANVDGHTPLPQDGVIRVTFDRYLLPLTANRQGVTLLDEFGNVPDPPVVQYDPVTLSVTIQNPKPGQPWLVVGRFYKVVFPVATDDGGPFGLRAIDRATIDPATPAITFQVAPPTGSPPVDPTIDFCSDVFPIFAAARSGTSARGACSSGVCHSAGGAQGLRLDTPDGIRETALGVEAAETTTAALSTPLPPQPAFPVGMPIIDPYDPGNSYLIYKLLLPDENGPSPTPGAPYGYTACKAVTPPFDYGPSASFASTDEAKKRLTEHVMGRRMPYADFDPATEAFSTPVGTSLTLDQVERVRLWIQQGAEVDDCSQCPSTVP